MRGTREVIRTLALPAEHVERGAKLAAEATGEVTCEAAEETACTAGGRRVRRLAMSGGVGLVGTAMGAASVAGCER